MAHWRPTFVGRSRPFVDQPLPAAATPAGLTLRVTCHHRAMSAWEQFRSCQRCPGPASLRRNAEQVVPLLQQGGSHRRTDICNILASAKMLQ